MYFIGEPFLPEPSGFQGYLARIRGYLGRARETSARSILELFFGRTLDPASFHIRGLHHVAVYLGDYRAEEEVERWLAFLRRVDGVSGVRCGPSYIAPRYHGAQAYWIDCHVDGAGAEMFTNKSMGLWESYEHAGKIARMSHFALAVEEAAHVRPLLDFFAHYPGFELLAFSPADELGHTYGHLLDGKTRRVLELVHSGQEDDHGGNRS